MSSRRDKLGINATFKNNDPVEIARKLRLSDGIGFLARVLSAKANLLFQQLTKQDDITPRQFGALLTLHQKGALTLTELARELRVDRSTLGEMMRRMTIEGLVSRSENAEDLRSYRVAITPIGRKVLLSLVSGAAQLQDALLECIPPHQRRDFYQALKAFAATSQDAGDT
ncbi:MarR family winged helix-turn-helix transcriptional regulator [Pseudorhodoplanes sp.]|uniref:MarR family winged helix-turn-helix transcriptional regulator n=1 Tax=Pseudorhodoplanes sp. TaxID=1934341 RepID=UPI003D14126A